VHVRAGRLRVDRVAGLAVPRGTAGLRPRVLVAEQVPRVEQDVRRRVRPADEVVDRGVHRCDSAPADCPHCDLRIRASCGRSLSTYLRPPVTAHGSQLGRGQHVQGRATGHGPRQSTRPRPARTRSGDPPRARGNPRAGRCPGSVPTGTIKKCAFRSRKAQVPHILTGSASHRLTRSQRRTSGRTGRGRQRRRTALPGKHPAGQRRRRVGVEYGTDQFGLPNSSCSGFCAHCPLGRSGIGGRRHRTGLHRLSCY
jgi:hypothetical protein